MKRKVFIKRIISIMSCVIIFFLSVWNNSLSVNASDDYQPHDIVEAIKYAQTTGNWESFWGYTADGLNLLQYISSQAGAIVGRDFQTWVANNKTFIDMGGSWYSLDEETNELTVTPDFVAALKQALKEYQNEQYGYQILPTIKYDQIPVSAFENASAYRTMCEIVSENKLIGVNTCSIALSIKDMSAYNNGSAGFVIHSYGNDYLELFAMDYISWQYATCDEYWAYKLDQTYKTFDELKEFCQTADSSPFKNEISQDKYGRVWISTTGCPSNYNNMWLVSYTGSDVLIFNSETSLQNYSVDKRGVFTTGGFYEDTGELTLKLDDLNNSIGDLTDLLSQFKDLLGQQEGGLTEEQLQQLLKQFLDDFFDRLGNQGGDDDNGGGSSSGGGSSGGISESFQRTIEGYFEGVLSYLDSILYEIQNLEFITAESSVDSEHSDLSDMFDLIWKDPENNTQVVADELSQSFGDIAGSITKKFPFSIPWDVYGLFTVLADVDPPQAASAYSLLLDDPDDAISGSDTYEMDVAVYSRDSNGNEHSAPYFELPIILERYGIEEYIIVDLQYFQPISTLSRTMLSLLFGVFLMKFTIKVIDLFKGGTDS